MGGFVRLAVPKLGCTLESTGGTFKSPDARSLIPCKLEYLVVEDRHQCFF